MFTIEHEFDSTVITLVDEGLHDVVCMLTSGCMLSHGAVTSFQLNLTESN